jgi:hypothetical protein
MSDALAPLAKSGEALKSGPIGLAIILLLCIACYFLFKSMSKHLKTVREDFPSDPAATADAVTPTQAEAQTAMQTAAQNPAAGPAPAQPAQPTPEPPERDA